MGVAHSGSYPFGEGSLLAALLGLVLKGNPSPGRYAYMYVYCMGIPFTPPRVVTVT